jgi:signal transduction histidine kinase/CheY-like chemotaxis protein
MALTAWGPRWAALAAIAALAATACIVICRLHSLRNGSPAQPKLDSASPATQERGAAGTTGEANESFAAYLAHEIRTPMTSILGFAEVLLEPESRAAEWRDALQSIQRNSRHLLELINDLLDYSKINAGQMTVEPAACELPDLIIQLVELTRPAILNKGLEFRLTLDGPVPRQIRTDPLRVRQILVNLIANATRFTEQGSIELRIGCRSGANGQGILRFAVNDSGIGMTADQVAHLFRPFAQAESSIERRFGGTGLGLTIARSLARLLGGDIAVESAPGRGSTFSVEIAAGPTIGAPTIDHLALPEPGEDPSNAEETGPAPVRLNGRVLLAEDGIDTQRLVARHLRRAGATVTVVGTGRAAVERLSAEPFDVVLMDLRMPDLDGYAAVAQLRAQGHTTPILALTANATRADCDRCLASGFDGYLTKPIEKRKLLAEVAPYLPADAEEKPRIAHPDAPLVSQLIDDPDVRDLLGDFVAVLPGKVCELLERLTRRELTGMRELAHQIKGGAGGYGFPQISDRAGELERLVQSGASRPMIERSAAELIALIRRVDGYAPSAEHPPRRRDVA